MQNQRLALWLTFVIAMISSACESKAQKDEHKTISFHNPNSFYLPSSYKVMQVEDLNNDDYPDLVLTPGNKNYEKHDGPSVLVMINNRKGGFEDSNFPTPYAHTIQWLRLVDFDLDGDLDVFLVNEERDHELSIYRNENDSILIKTENLFYNISKEDSREFNQPFVHDINKDNYPDLIFIAGDDEDRHYIPNAGPYDQYDGHHLYILENNKEGGFNQLSDLTLPKEARNSFLNITDINTDGKIDLVVNYKNILNLSEIVTYTGQGNGIFKLVSDPMSIPVYGEGLVFDVDGDNKKDILIQNRKDKSLLRGDGKGRFEPIKDINFNDFDSPLFLDDAHANSHKLLYHHAKNEKITSLNFELSGTIVETDIFNLGKSYYNGSIIRQDLNGDGNPDLLIHGIDNNRSWNCDLYFHTTNRNKPYTSQNSFSQSQSFVSEVADLNNDGAIDIKLKNAEKDLIYINNGQGVFNLEAEDNHDTLFIESKGSERLKLVVRNTNRFIFNKDFFKLFETNKQYAPNESYEKITNELLDTLYFFEYTYLDFDNDGNKELLLYTITPLGHTYYLLSYVKQVWQIEKLDIGIPSAGFTFYEDLNNDKLVDIVLVSPGKRGTDAKMSVFMQQKNLNFQLSHEMELNMNRELIDVSVKDIDGDQYPDVLLYGVQNDFNLSILRNDGKGSFKEKQLINVQLGGVKKPKLEDFNRDGFDDLFVNRRIYFNDGTGAFIESDTLMSDQYDLEDVVTVNLNNDDKNYWILQHRTLDIMTNGHERKLFNTEIYTSNDKGKLVTTSTFPIENFSGKITPLDIDQDGDQDLLCEGLNKYDDFIRVILINQK